MLEIYADDVPPLRLADLARLMVSPDLAAICTAVLAAYRLEGWLGEAARDAVDQALAGQSEPAVAALLQQLPEDLADVITAETLLAGNRLRWLADAAGNVACIGSRNATIGTAAQWHVHLRGAARRAAARTGYAGALVAARLERPVLRVVA